MGGGGGGEGVSHIITSYYHCFVAASGIRTEFKSTNKFVFIVYIHILIFRRFLNRCVA